MHLMVLWPTQFTSSLSLCSGIPFLPHPTANHSSQECVKHTWAHTGTDTPRYSHIQMYTTLSLTQVLDSQAWNSLWKSPLPNSPFDRRKLGPKGSQSARGRPRATPRSRFWPWLYVLPGTPPTEQARCFGEGMVTGGGMPLCGQVPVSTRTSDPSQRKRTFLSFFSWLHFPAVGDQGTQLKPGSQDGSPF